jgi:hypothetical protein
MKSSEATAVNVRAPRRRGRPPGQWYQEQQVAEASKRYGQKILCTREVVERLGVPAYRLAALARRGWAPSPIDIGGGVNGYLLKEVIACERARRKLPPPLYDVKPDYGQRGRRAVAHG